MRILRALYNRAVNEELTDDRHPFGKVYTGVAKTVKRGISTEYVARILRLDLSSSPSRAFARDVFMFCFYTRGMSLIDIAKLRLDDIKNGVLTYQRSKTGQRISVKWRKEMQAIVDRHHRHGGVRLLPIVKQQIDERKRHDAALHNINYHLKKIGEAIGLPIPLTMYVARHSWASAARQSNIPLSVISQCLGHDSERTIQIYLASVDVDEMDDANEKVIRRVFRARFHKYLVPRGEKKFPQSLILREFGNISFNYYLESFCRPHVTVKVLHQSPKTLDGHWGL